MKLLVASDSHGNRDALTRALLKESPDALAFLGDGWRDIPADLSIPIYQVRGNCDDSLCGKPETLLAELEGVRILMAHGHTFDAKSTVMFMHIAAIEANADIMLYGHTHMQQTDTSYGTPCFFNPGSIAHAPHPYGVIILQNGEFHCRECMLI